MGRRRKPSKVVPPPPENPWDRQLRESDRAWEAFTVYRDLGPGYRTLAAVSKSLPKASRSHIWSSEWEWVARCHAYDSWRDQQSRAIELEEIRDMKRRQTQLGMALQGAAGLALQKLLAEEKAVTKNPDGTFSPARRVLKPAELHALADLGSKLERLNRDQPDTIQEQRQSVTVEDRRPAVRKLTIDKAGRDYLRKLLEGEPDGSGELEKGRG